VPHARYRPAVDCARDLEHYREANPAEFPTQPDVDLKRGEIRFASEVMIAAVMGNAIPREILERALHIAAVMARG
jgi:hypothetical protein